eukprot:TRINITY_DN7006_c2_g1_i1.p1 TRINITY_DN7006_c2_g1~~TRINITY_DN7006_c2_g1_i1.p1  ORF type:complete len:518 (+),score=51.06 TRINITY_DN7006_c2_g1_i1:8-1561(+)
MQQAVWGRRATVGWRNGGGGGGGAVVVGERGHRVIPHHPHYNCTSAPSAPKPMFAFNAPTTAAARTVPRATLGGQLARGRAHNSVQHTRFALFSRPQHSLRSHSHRRGYCSQPSHQPLTLPQPCTPPQPLPVRVWLGTCCVLVYGMVVVGGMTRLTESGLSIVQWKPVSGALPPMSQEEWQREFDNYKQFPEYKRINHGLTLEGFKEIFWWEWGHRNLGRVIGLTFVLPYTYFLLRRGYFRSRAAAGPLVWQLPLIGAGIGFQGALGWYMVQSGLEEDVVVPRVSPYRLTAHLASAFALYSGMLWIFMDMCTPRAATIATAATAGGAVTAGAAAHTPLLPGATSAELARFRRFKIGTVASTCLVALTVLAGAFVAGNDAGLVYNEFPLMGGRWIPPELWDLNPAWRNLFENDVTVQFNHRYLGLTTLATILTTWNMGRRLPLPRYVKMPMHLMAGMAGVQVTLGIVTLLSFVQTHVAATHQAGSLTLLTFALWLLHTVKRRRLMGPPPPTAAVVHPK